MIALEHMLLGNGGGSIKTLDDVIKACKTPMTHIEVGSITLKHRQGNLGETYYFHPQDSWSLNALGLPNGGWEYYKEHLPKMVVLAHDAGKKLRANIAPFSPEECGKLAYLCFDAGADDVVINGSCPNVWDGGKQKAIPSLNPVGAEALLAETRAYVGDKENIWFKLSPIDDLALVRKLVDVFGKYDISKLVCCNTKGGESGTREDGTPALAFRANETDEVHHVGGLAGDPIHAESLATAAAFIQRMHGAQVVGLGGIFNGTDAQNFLNVGCVGVQSTTGYLQSGGRIFVEILKGLVEESVA